MNQLTISFLLGLLLVSCFQSAVAQQGKGVRLRDKNAVRWDAKSLKKEGFKVADEFAISLDAQVDRFNRMSTATNSNGDALFFTAISLEEGSSFHEATIRAILNANLNLCYECGLCEEPVESSIEIEDGKRASTFSKKSNFSSSTSINQSIEIKGVVRTRNLSYRSIGLPLLGVQKVMLLYRLTDDNEFVVLCGLSVEKSWLDKNGYDFDY